MNESTLLQLKILVERAVRPVRVSSVYKRKMREELLAHVSGVFEEEVARLGDAQAALACTEERFGQPSELAVQLRASVPNGDGMARFVESYFEGFHPGASALRRATLHAVMLSLFYVFLAVVAPLQQPIFRATMWVLIPVAAFLAFTYTLLQSWIHDALFGASGRSWIRFTVVGSVASLLIPAMLCGFSVYITGEWWASLWISLPLLPWAVVLIVPVMAVLAQVQEKRLRYRREWEGLEIG